MSEWVDRVEANRAEKDEFFGDDPRSPLAPDERADFEGLRYFDPDPAYRTEATVTVNDDPEPVELTAENGPAERFVHAVTFTFDLPRDDATDEPNPDDAATVTETLHGYRREGEGPDLFVPFRDKTTGQETYRGGRYMDLHPDRELRDDDRVTLDFNLAYTPFCAFDDAFVCPLPPEDNWLSVAVRAGERDPPV